jgi:hypothetical protein
VPPISGNSLANEALQADRLAPYPAHSNKGSIGPLPLPDRDSTIRAAFGQQLRLLALHGLKMKMSFG